MDQANQISPRHHVGSDLAHAALYAVERDPNQKLAWVNSICLLILLIGILGARFGSFRPRPVAPIEQAVPAIVEPLPPPPQTPSEVKPQEQTEPTPSDTPQVVVVTPDAPNINFSVPTIGNLVVPNAIAKPPPLNPLRAPAPLKNVPANLDTTGNAGDRPQPPYPKIALDTGQQGSVTLSMTADEAGNIIDVQVKKSSGSPVLDRSSIDYVKRHWRLPVETGNRLFESTVNYRITR